MPGPVLVVPTRTLVMASETQPARFRPGNQLRLQPAKAMNPATHGGTNFMPSFLDYRGPNAINDMGLGWRKSRAQKVPHAQNPVTGGPSNPARPLGTRNSPPLNTTNPSALTAPQATPVAMSGLGSLGVTSMEELGISIALGLAVGGAIWWFIKRKKK
jgi:hypothetical protein